MSGWDDLPVEMRGERIDDQTVDRLLRGRLAPDDAPPGYSDVASILLAVASHPAQEELSMQTEHVAAARTLVGRSALRRHARIRRLTAGLMVAGALAAVPGLAAANVLPDAAQNAVSGVLDKVGISVPNTQDHPTEAPADHPASTGTEISGLATTTDATGVAKGVAISSVASGGKSQAGQHGQADEHGQAGQHGQADASHGSAGAAHATSNAGGNGKAGQHGGGRSALGSGNVQASRP